MNQTPLQLLIYVSQMNEPLNTVELSELVVSAEKKNKEIGVTGVLLVLSDHFVQFLEGKAEDVQPLLESIKKDPRHERLEVILTQEIEKRAFADWGMSGVFFGSRLFVTDDDIVDLKKKVESIIFERGANVESLRKVLTTVPRLLLEKKLPTVDLTQATSRA